MCEYHFELVLCVVNVKRVVSMPLPSRQTGWLAVSVRLCATQLYKHRFILTNGKMMFVLYEQFIMRRYNEQLNDNENKRFISKTKWTTKNKQQTRTRTHTHASHHTVIVNGMRMLVAISAHTANDKNRLHLNKWQSHNTSTYLNVVTSVAMSYVFRVESSLLHCTAKAMCSL